MATNDDLIFGKTWEDIQAMQQGRYAAPMLRGPVAKPCATDADREMLRSEGADAIRAKGFFGVLDRLTTSELI